jgi:hypothetical protein
MRRRSSLLAVKRCIDGHRAHNQMGINKGDSDRDTGAVCNSNGGGVGLEWRSW